MQGVDEVTTIPRSRRVFYDTYANLPTTNVAAGDLGYATDRLVLYRWSGAAWQAISFHTASGATGAKPAAADLPNGSLYYDTTLSRLEQVQAGAWVAIVTTATKEPYFSTNGGTDSHIYATALWGTLINAAADQAFINFDVPADFTSITSIVVIRFSIAAATHRLNYASSYGAVGASFISHQETLIDQDTVEVLNGLYSQDISGILTNLAAGDNVHIEVEGDAVNVPNDYIVGVRFKYA